MNAAAPSIHRHAIGATAFAALVLCLVATGTSLAAWIETLLRDGTFALVWATACVGVGRLIIPRRWLESDSISAALRTSTHFAIGAGTIGLVVLLSGLAGVLNSAVAWALIGVGLIGVAVPIVRALKSKQKLAIPVSAASWAWLLCAPAVAVLLVAPSVLPGVLWGDEPHGYDVVEYHLQIPREWHDAGRITRLPHNVFSNFPLGMEMHYLLAMHLRGGAYGGMYLAQYMHAVCAAFTAIAVYGLLGGRAKPQAVGAAVLTLATPWTAIVGTVAYNEAALMLFGVLCIGWIWKITTDAPESRLRFTVIAALMGGFACGVKLTAIPMIVFPALIGIFIALRKLAALKFAVLFLIISAVVASPWWIRNIAWTGNPVFPEATSILGGRDWSAAQQERWRAAHSPREDQKSVIGRGRAFHEQVQIDWKFAYWIVPATLCAVAFIAVKRRFKSSAVLIIAVLIQFLFWIYGTHLQGRFLVVVIPIAAMLLIAPGFEINPLVIGASLLAAVASSISVARLANDGVRPAIGIREPAALWELHPEIPQAVRDSTQPLALVGDAKAFWWPTAPGRLHYRTVFDVEVREGESLIDAWLRGAPSEAIIVVDPSELRRFAGSYKNLGRLPPEIVEADRPFILQRTPPIAPTENRKQ